MSYNILKRRPGYRQKRNGRSRAEQVESMQDALMVLRKARGQELLARMKVEKDARAFRCLLNELLQIRAPEIHFRPTKGYLVRSGKRLFNVRTQQKKAA